MAFIEGVVAPAINNKINGKFFIFYKVNELII
jgi:hypothetical protein